MRTILHIAATTMLGFSVLVGCSDGAAIGTEGKANTVFTSTGGALIDTQYKDYDLIQLDLNDISLSPNANYELSFSAQMEGADKAELTVDLIPEVLQQTKFQLQTGENEFSIEFATTESVEADLRLRFFTYQAQTEVIIGAVQVQLLP